MKFAKTLSRNEMKDIMAGETLTSCEYEGCSGSSAVFNCWRADCSRIYGFSQEAVDCVNQVGESEKHAISMCGLSYS